MSKCLYLQDLSSMHCKKCFPQFVRKKVPIWEIYGKSQIGNFFPQNFISNIILKFSNLENFLIQYFFSLKFREFFVTIFFFSQILRIIFFNTLVYFSLPINLSPYWDYFPTQRLKFSNFEKKNIKYPGLFLASHKFITLLRLKSCLTIKLSPNF